MENALTRRYASPPYRISEVSKAVAIKAMLFHGRIEALLCDDKTRTCILLASGVLKRRVADAPMASDELTANMSPTYLSTALAAFPVFCA
jgi:hypothetical protein